MANNFRVGKIIRTEAELDAFLKAAGTPPEFTDENGNPVEVDNHPVRAHRPDYNPRPRPERPKRYTGYVPAPEVYSTLEGGMVPTGVDLYQCEYCGWWLSRKMTSSEERDHDRQCRGW